MQEDNPYELYDSDDESNYNRVVEICRCQNKPPDCVCFKKRCYFVDTKEYAYSTPPPSPILRHEEEIQEYRIDRDRFMYVKMRDGKEVQSKKSLDEYNFPHCHRRQCREQSFAIWEKECKGINDF